MKGNRNPQTKVAGFKVTPQSGNAIRVSTTNDRGPQTDYFNVLDEGNDLTSRSGGQNVLPINFCHSPSEYNRILITYGKTLVKPKATKAQVSTVQFLNDSVLRRNQQERDRVKELYMMREQLRQRQITVEIQKCNCCCCDDFCEVCNQEMHFNFDSQSVQSAAPTVKPRRHNADRQLKSPTKLLQPKQVQWINKSQISRNERSKKRNHSQKKRCFNFQQDHRIDHLVKASISRQKQIQQQEYLSDPAQIAKAKIARIRSYDNQRKSRVSDSLKKVNSVQKHPWGYQKPQSDKNYDDDPCHPPNSAGKPNVVREIFSHLRAKVKKVQWEEGPCHPHDTSLSPEVALMKRIMYGQVAKDKNHKERQRKIQEKIRITNNLRKLQFERKDLYAQQSNQGGLGYT